ncbi:MAG: hypothetical protein OXH85_08210 [Truepera sp.]|nr:hypothetical protein [Truepera sp.]
MERYSDIDTSFLTLEFASDAIGAIQSSRRASYGHDIRPEVHLRKGQGSERGGACHQGVVLQQAEDRRRLHQNFRERSRPAYLAELQAFTAAVQGGVDPSPVPNRCGRIAAHRPSGAA